MKPTLVLLAAGMGSRFGGLKQLVPVGPAGASLMEYSIHDALGSGFGKIVFIIRKETEEQFRKTVERRIGARAPIAYAHQHLELLPEGFEKPASRAKPWGTGHAVLCAEPHVDEPFVVINADDYYGANAFSTLRTFLDAHAGSSPPSFAMLGFRLRDTVPPTGSVSRGVCAVDGKSELVAIEETLGIEAAGGGFEFPGGDGSRKTLTGEELVSMNIWAFTPAVFDQLRVGFRDFLTRFIDEPTAEYYLPFLVQQAIREDLARVTVLPAGETWFGMTHPDDLQAVKARLRRLTDEGVYPEDLWSAS